MKFEIKREVVKRKTISNWGRVFQTALKSGEEGWEFWLFNAFLMLHIRFGNHRLIKINMIYVYIKPEVKKNDATAVIAALCCVITWKLQFGEVDFFGMENEHFFCVWAKFFPHLQGFLENNSFGERGRTVYRVCGQQARWKKEKHFW